MIGGRLRAVNDARRTAEFALRTFVTARWVVLGLGATGTRGARIVCGDGRSRGVSLWLLATAVMACQGGSQASSTTMFVLVCSEARLWDAWLGLSDGILVRSFEVMRPGDLEG